MAGPSSCGELLSDVLLFGATVAERLDQNPIRAVQLAARTFAVRLPAAHRLLHVTLGHDRFGLFSVFRVSDRFVLLLEDLIDHVAQLEQLLLREVGCGFSEAFNFAAHPSQRRQFHVL